MTGRSYTLIEVSHEAGVARVTLNNPGRRNAIGPRMVNELLYALEDAFADEAVRSVVLTGKGEAFCAGGDLSQMSGGADEDALPPKGDYADLLKGLVRASKPVVARVNGHAMGGGLGLVAACHFAIGVYGAKLGTPEINVGLFPMMIMAVLRRIMPRRAMVRMMLLGGRYTAEEAVEVGLLNEVVVADQLDEAVAAITNTVANKSPKAMALGLAAIAEQDDLDLDAALPLLSGKLAEMLATEDAREGLMAFMQKREPRWTGR